MGKKFVFSLSLIFLVAGCSGGGGGDINIRPSTVDNSTNNSNNTTTGGGDDNADDICASYTNSGGQLIQGSADAAGNCTYSSAFLDAGNPLTVDMTIPLLAGGGAHQFEGSVFVALPCGLYCWSL